MAQLKINTLMSETEIKKLLDKLVGMPKETEWVEFKHNFHSIEEIGETLSALSNGACMHNQSCGYLIFGIEDGSHKIVGTNFKPSLKKKGNEELEHWIAQRLNPRVDFRIFEFEHNGLAIALFQVDATSNQPTDFLNDAYIRVGSITRKLRDFPEKERKIWRKFHQAPFERNIAKTSISDSEVIQLLDSQSYFDMLELPYPTTQDSVLKKFETEGLIQEGIGGWAITNLGAVLFAKNMASFSSIARKAMRVVVYEGKNKINTKKDITGMKGYAVGFEGLISFINDQLPLMK